MMTTSRLGLDRRTPSPPPSTALPRLTHRRWRSLFSLLGRTVCSEAGEPLGVLEDVILDHVSGDIAYVILKAQLEGMTQARHWAVPWSALRRGRQRGEIRLNVAPETLRHAPALENTLPSVSPPA